MEILNLLTQFFISLFTMLFSHTKPHFPLIWPFAHSSKTVGSRSKISPQQVHSHGQGPSSHCCGCGSGSSSYFFVSSQHEHSKNAHSQEHNSCRGQQNQCGRQEEVDYYVCDCYACRSTGAPSLEVCCQCCNCTNSEPNQNISPRYHVSSVMLKGESDDTLEVCLRRQDEDELNDVEDDIALAHAVAEATRQHRVYTNHHNHRGINQPAHCNDCSNCCSSVKRGPRGPAPHPQQHFKHGHSHNLSNPRPNHSSHRMLNNKHKKLSSTRHSCTKGNISTWTENRKKPILDIFLVFFFCHA